MSEKLYVLGTGNAQAINCFNTCFAIQESEKEFLLVDAGGGNGIMKVLRDAGIEWNMIHHLIVTHEHTDHVLGVVWVVRMIATAMIGGQYEGTLTIYAHEDLCEIIRTLCRLTLQKKHFAMLDDRIILKAVKDCEVCPVLSYQVTFFDIQSTKAKQFGFMLHLQNGKKLCCLGDEPYNPVCEPFAALSDWLLCEAFCLYADRDRFKPYEKNHSTVLDAAELGAALGVKNLVLWHTEDSDLEHRREKYEAEAANSFPGLVYVPDDGEVIEL